MEIQEKVVWEESQKIHENWVWQLVLAISVISVGIMLGVMLSEQTEWYLVVFPALAIALVDVLVIAAIKGMTLRLAITRKGFYYRLWPPGNTYKYIDWNEVKEIRFTRSPVPGYGKKIHWKYGTVYSMSSNKEKGVEFVFKSDKKIFFSTRQPDLIRSILQKTEIQIPVTTT